MEKTKISNSKVDIMTKFTYKPRQRNRGVSKTKDISEQTKVHQENSRT